LHQEAARPLSVYMITYNNGATLDRALKSVSGWAPEIVIVDSESTDGSLEIMNRYGVAVHQYVTTDLRAKYQSAQDRCSSPWVLFIDADEWLTPQIKEEIDAILPTSPETDAFVVRRRNFFMGREIRHGAWAKDREIRLYRKDKGRWEGGIHAKVHVDGQVGELKNHYLHTPYTNISHQVRKLDHYSEVFAQDLAKTGGTFSLLKLATRPLSRFMRDYVLKRGFTDGVPGLVIAASDTYYVFLKYAKLWELQPRRDSKGAGKE
jgi:glycosyltransferase involved in cell wall biosynthesis